MQHAGLIAAPAVLHQPSQFFLGGLSYVLNVPNPPIRLDAGEAYRSFLLSDPTPSRTSKVVRVTCVVAENPSFLGEAIFRSDATWAILARGHDRALEFRSPDGEVLYVAQFRPGADDVTVLCSPRLLGTRETTTAIPPYPLDQVLTMYLLDGAGVVLHAAGALVGCQGIALAGVSGAGKSTVMRLADGRPGWQPLSDDRVILRLDGDLATIHGTPWPGEGQVAENLCGPLARLLFLDQASTNEVRSLAPQEALGRLLRMVSVPWYDREYLGRALAACGGILERVPSALLAFRREQGALDAVERCLADGGATPMGIDP
jgi:hypothetical protein